MKPSELTTDYLRDFLRIDDMGKAEQEITNRDLEAMQAAAVKFAESYTGLPITSESGDRCLDDYDDVAIAILAIVADMYENRAASVDKQTYQNKTVECILSMHSYNLV